MRKHVATWTVLAWLYAAAFVVGTLGLHQGDWMYFAHISPFFANNDVSEPWHGWDGQFAYFIARDPTGASPHLDVPFYRYQRILYPMLVRLLALGQADWVPVTLVLVNVLLIGLGTGAFAALLYRENAPTWLPLVFFAWLGVEYSLLFDLNEITAMAFAMWALVFFHRKQIIVAGILLGMGALAKDMALLFALPVLIILTLQREWRNAIQIAVLSFVPYFAWWVVLRLLFGHWQTDALGGSYFATPCLNDPTVPFAIAFAFVPAVTLVFISWKQWRELYFAATVTAVLFYAFLIAGGYCGHALFRLSTPLVLATALWLARQHRRLWLVVCGAGWIGTAVLAWLIVLTE